MKSTDKLEKLLEIHPRWNILKEKLSYGCEYPVKDLDEEVRLLDLKENLNRGNHKSAKRNDEHLGKVMMKEIQKGWSLILPEDSVLTIPNLELAPIRRRASRYQQSCRIHYKTKGDPRPFLPRYNIKGIN